MAGDILQKYGSSAQTITITLHNIGTGTSQQSNAVDNTSNLFSDALVSLKFKAPASSTSTSGVVYLYAYGTVDGGTTYTDGATGTAGSITQTNPTNLRLIGVINVVSNGVTYYGGPFSVAQAFGGVLPAKWGIVWENQTGGTSDTTAGNHSMQYQGVYGQYT